MQTAFSCRENLEDKRRFCQRIILAHIIFMPQSKVIAKNVFCKRCPFLQIIKKIELCILRKRSIMVIGRKFFQE